MSIRQKASGFHTATFPAPTIAGTGILVLIASADGGLAITDDKGNSYETNIGNTGQFAGAGGTQTAFPPTFHTIVAGVSTVTSSDPTAHLWIYEIANLTFVGSGNPLFPDDWPDTYDGVTFNSGGPVFLDPTWPWLWQNNLGNGQTLPATDDYFTIVYGEGAGNFSAVDSSWTLDSSVSIYSGHAAVAYKLASGGSTVSGTFGCQGLTFTPSQPTNWCGSGFSFRVDSTPVVGLCGPTPPVGDPYAGGELEIIGVLPIVVTVLNSGLDQISSNIFTGDAGVGGLQGDVPPPPSGSAAAGMFLSASGIWAVPLSASGALIGTVGIVVNDLTATGSKGVIQVPYNGTIQYWTLLADQSGSAQFDVKKGTYAAFPTNSSIVASAPPKLTSQQKNTDSTLTGWTTTVNANDIFEFVLNSSTTVTRLTLEIYVKKRS